MLQFVVPQAEVGGFAVGILHNSNVKIEVLKLWSALGESCSSGTLLLVHEYKTIAH